MTPKSPPDDQMPVAADDPVAPEPDEEPGVGAGALYGFRVQGPYDPKRGLRFDPSKLLADPYAWRFDRPFELHSSMVKFGEDTGPHTPQAFA